MNRKTAERLYTAFLLDNEHQKNMFGDFLIENFNMVCPTSGVITYEEGKVSCSVHEDTEVENENQLPSDEVPWL